MLLSVPAQAFAEVNYNNLTGDKSEIVNKLTPVKPAKTDKAADLIKNPEQPAIYTLRTDFKVQRGEKYEVDYQPYIASVGAAATNEEKAKVKKTIDLPALAGYDEPEDNFKIDYKTVKEAADGKGKTGDDVNGFRYSDKQDFKYTARSNSIKIKHVFQDLEDFTKYTNPDGSTDEEHALFTTQQGNTGSTMEVSPLDKNDPRVKGFVPEADSITMQVPENATNFILEYRYNRAHYDVVFDTAGGTELPARTLYTGQVIPKLADEAIPTKVGGKFQGWKPSVDLESIDGSKYRADGIIKDTNGKAILNLAADIKMPASKVTFTAVWKDKDKAGYAVQFWAEKADHADGASLADKYDYIGTRVYKDQTTGSRPDLDNEPVKDIVFPDLDQFRLKKIWNGDRFNRTKDLYLNKFYVYNQDLTHEQNKDPANVNLVKSVDATGKTVYNIYYDRQVYELYFTESNYLKDKGEGEEKGKNTFYPEIWGYDKDNNLVKLGGPGNPYHYKARFNQLMLGWPNDAMQTKGFSPNMQSFGWGPNYDTPDWPTHLDTPPYRLNADEFLDMGVKTGDYTRRGGYTKNIDKGDGTTINLNWFDFTTLSFGIKQAEDSMPHHMDFWMDGFKDGETIIRYDLYRSKADTNSKDYAPRYPKVQGFTGKRDFEPAKFFTADDVDKINAERAAVTPFPTKTYTVFGNELPVGKMQFISAFFNNADDWGDPDGWDGFKENGYLRFKYTRNKYPLRFNCDPSVIKGDNEFNSTNQLQTFYEFPLKALSPKVDTTDEYKKDNPANLLDNPENLQKLGLTDLIFTDTDGKLKVKRPDNLSDQMVFKGWALDPAGTKLIWENPGEIMPNHPVNLYAKWGEPDYKWKVTFDPNGGSLRNIREEDLTTSRKKIQEGDIGQEEINTYAKKEANDGDKQIFTVIQRQKLVEPKKPTRKGYDFMGWEVIRYKKDNKGDYTNEVDNSYREIYKVPELYSFGNDVVAPVYLKAIWVPNDRVDVKVEHHILSLDLSKEIEMRPETLHSKRAGYLVATTGDQQDDEYILAPHEELIEKLPDGLKALYTEYNARVKADNTYFQTFKVEPEKIDDGSGNLIPNPDAKNNVFHFFYRPFRTRDYKVNYIDERFKGKTNEAEGAIVPQELVSNGNRHYDARNYRPIPGWKLTSAPQQQLFFDVNEQTNEFIGINGTGSNEITFYYKDVRVIEVPKDDPVPDGYVRVTFKAEEGGSFGKDDQGKDIKELNYDVIKGLKSDFLPVPKELAEGETPETDKHYITPEPGKKFIKWDNRALLNDNTIINDSYTFTAYFDWKEIKINPLVVTESFKDPNGTWTNDFAPTVDKLKGQVKWYKNKVEEDLPAGVEVIFADDIETTLADSFKELGKADKDELVREVKIPAKIKYADNSIQDIEIPVTVYKNVYEALTNEEKPLFLREAEEKLAKDGGLKDVTGEYVMVKVNPTGDADEKDTKTYYVNPKAWVNIPEITLTDADKAKIKFLNWTADKINQNEDNNENGIFDFTKRHKFTEKTEIKPASSGDVVEQTDPNKKPNVPSSYVKVIVTTTDKATDDSKFEKTFWVNPNKEVPIEVTNPTGKADVEVELKDANGDSLGNQKVTYTFIEWQKVKTGSDDNNLTDLTPAATIDLAKNQYIDKVTVVEASYEEEIDAAELIGKSTVTKLDTPKGKEITDDSLKDKITPPEGKTIQSIEVISKPDKDTVGKSDASVIITYTDGTTEGTNTNPVKIPVEVHEPIIPANKFGDRPEGAMDNYVKITFKAGTGGSVDGTLIYFVSPEVEVDMTEAAGKVTKTPDIGYISGDWDTSSKALKATFDADTEFTFNFTKSEDIVEKTPQVTEAPKGYVTVKFITDGNGKINGVDEKIYYVNPTAGITLKVLKANETATEKQLVVPTPTANDNFTFKEWQESIDETTPITSERVHVAIFQSGQVTLTYNKGGDDVTGTVPGKATVGTGKTVWLANKGDLTKPNATFIGWKLDEDDTIYQPGAQITLDKNRTATAQWSSSVHTVTFNTMGGTDVASQKVEHGKKLTNVAIPTLDGKVFMGWKEKGKESDPAYFDLASAITEDKTLIAQWQDKVQRINDGDTVEEQFIKVTFLKGSHGNLIGDVTYKVAKDLTFDQAKAAGLKVPEIVPDKYYKAKDLNNGWDQELALNNQDVTFIAQYEPKANVIPVDPNVVDETQIQEEKPDDMVLVTFKVSDDSKFYIPNNAKYYVKKNVEVRILTPVVLEKNIGDSFKGWKDVNIVSEPMDLNTINDPYAVNFQWVKQSFTQDTIISDENLADIKIVIDTPLAGSKRILIKELSDGAKGKLEIIRAGNVISSYENNSYRRRGETFHLFNLNDPLQAGDIIRYWADDGIRSCDPILETIH